MRDLHGRIREEISSGTNLLTLHSPLLMQALDWHMPCNIHSSIGGSIANLTGHESGANLHIWAKAHWLDDETRLGMISRRHGTLSGSIMLGIMVPMLGTLEQNLCSHLYLWERGKRVGHRLELETVGSAKECGHTALFLVMNDNCVEGGTSASIAQ